MTDKPCPVPFGTGYKLPTGSGGRYGHNPIGGGVGRGFQNDGS